MWKLSDFHGNDIPAVAAAPILVGNGNINEELLGILREDSNI